MSTSSLLTSLSNNLINSSPLISITSINKIIEYLYINNNTNVNVNDINRVVQILLDNIVNKQNVINNMCMEILMYVSIANSKIEDIDYDISIEDYYKEDVNKAVLIDIVKNLSINNEVINIELFKSWKSNKKLNPLLSYYKITNLYRDIVLKLNDKYGHTLSHISNLLKCNVLLEIENKTYGLNINEDNGQTNPFIAVLSNESYDTLLALIISVLTNDFKNSQYTIPSNISYRVLLPLIDHILIKCNNDIWRNKLHTGLVTVVVNNLNSISNKYYTLDLIILLFSNLHRYNDTTFICIASSQLFEVLKLLYALNTDKSDNSIKLLIKELFIYYLSNIYTVLLASVHNNIDTQSLFTIFSDLIQFTMETEYMYILSSFESVFIVLYSIIYSIFDGSNNFVKNWLEIVYLIYIGDNKIIDKLIKFAACYIPNCNNISLIYNSSNHSLCSFSWSGSNFTLLDVPPSGILENLSVFFAGLHNDVSEIYFEAFDIKSILANDINTLKNVPKIYYELNKKSLPEYIISKKIKNTTSLNDRNCIPILFFLINKIDSAKTIYIKQFQAFPKVLVSALPYFSYLLNNLFNSNFDSELPKAQLAVRLLDFMSNAAQSYAPTLPLVLPTVLSLVEKNVISVASVLYELWIAHSSLQLHFERSISIYVNTSPLTASLIIKRICNENPDLGVNFLPYVSKLLHGQTSSVNNAFNALTQLCKSDQLDFYILFALLKNSIFNITAPSVLCSLLEFLSCGVEDAHKYEESNDVLAVVIFYCNSIIEEVKCRAFNVLACYVPIWPCDIWKLLYKFSKFSSIVEVKKLVIDFTKIESIPDEKSENFVDEEQQNWYILNCQFFKIHKQGLIALLTAISAKELVVFGRAGNAGSTTNSFLVEASLNWKNIFNRKTAKSQKFWENSRLIPSLNQSLNILKLGLLEMGNSDFIDLREECLKRQNLIFSTMQTTYIDTNSLESFINCWSVFINYTWLDFLNLDASFNIWSSKLDTSTISDVEEVLYLKIVAKFNEDKIFEKCPFSSYLFRFLLLNYLTKASKERQTILLFNEMHSYMSDWINGLFNKEFSTDEFFFTYYFFYLHLLGPAHFFTIQKNTYIDLNSFIDFSNFVDFLPASFIQAKNLRLMASGIICNSLVNCESTMGIKGKHLSLIVPRLLEQCLFDLFRNENLVALMQIDSINKEIISNSKMMSEAFLLNIEESNAMGDGDFKFKFECMLYFLPVLLKLKRYSDLLLLTDFLVAFVFQSHERKYFNLYNSASKLLLFYLPHCISLKLIKHDDIVALFDMLFNDLNDISSLPGLVSLFKIAQNLKLFNLEKLCNLETMFVEKILELLQLSSLSDTEISSVLSALSALLNLECIPFGIQKNKILNFIEFKNKNTLTILSKVIAVIESICLNAEFSHTSECMWFLGELTMKNFNDLRSDKSTLGLTLIKDFKKNSVLFMLIDNVSKSPEYVLESLQDFARVPFDFQLLNDLRNSPLINSSTYFKFIARQALVSQSTQYRSLYYSYFNTIQNNLNDYSLHIEILNSIVYSNAILSNNQASTAICDILIYYMDNFTLKSNFSILFLLFNNIGALFRMKLNGDCITVSKELISSLLKTLLSDFVLLKFKDYIYDCNLFNLLINSICWPLWSDKSFKDLLNIEVCRNDVQEIMCCVKIKLFALSSLNKDFCNSWLKSDETITECRDFCLRSCEPKLIYYFCFELFNSNSIKSYFKLWLLELLELFINTHDPNLFYLISLLSLFNFNHTTAFLYSNFNDANYEYLLNMSVKMLPESLPPLLIQSYLKLDQVISKLKLVITSTKKSDDKLIKDIKKTTIYIVNILETKLKS